MLYMVPLRSKEEAMSKSKAQLLKKVLGETYNVFILWICGF